MNGEYECIHCGEIDHLPNHWEGCMKHPAREIINRLVDEIKQLEDEAAKWHDLKPIYDNCEKEVKELEQKILELQKENKQLKQQLQQDDQRAWEALGKPEGTYDTTNVERLCRQIEANKALFEICANAIVQHYQALKDNLPAKAESFLQELLKALYIYCPKEPQDVIFSELASEMRLHIWTFKYNES